MSTEHLLLVLVLVFIGISLALVIPWLYSLHSTSFLNRKTIVSTLLFIHSLFALHTLLINPPPNLFSTLHIPLNTPTDTIRAILLSISTSPDLSPELDDLLVRLASFDARSLYPRFGHNVLATCTYCRSADDFALYALPRAVLSYICEIAFIGLISPHRRKLGAIVLTFMAVGEAYLLATATIQIPQRGVNQPVIMWHDILLNIRHVIFLIFPLLVYFLPAPRFRIPFIYNPRPKSCSDPIDMPAVLLQTQHTLTHLLSSLHLLKYGQAATMRVPSLHARATSWWEEEARVGALIRADGLQAGDSTVNVRSVARGLDLSFEDATEGREEGKLLTNAKAAVRGLINDGIRPSNHWLAPTS